MENIEYKYYQTKHLVSWLIFLSLYQWDQILYVKYLIEHITFMWMKSSYLKSKPGIFKD